MRTDTGVTRATPRTSLCMVGVLLALFLTTAASRTAAQSVRVNRETEVAQVRFRVTGGPTPYELANDVATKGRGRLVRLRRAFGWVPFVPPIPDHAFNAFELQRDKERIRRRYARMGYPAASVDYDVQRASARNEVVVTFLIRPGPPLVIASVTVLWDSAGPSPTAFADRFTAPVLGMTEGTPLADAALNTAVGAVTRWLANRGYAFATVTPDVDVDSVTSRADVTLRVAAGPRTKIGAIAIEGNEVVPTSTIRGLLDVRTGDWYSADRVQQAGQRIALLDAVSRATFERAPATPGDSVIDLNLRVREEPPRRIVGQIGYTTDGGITGEATWTHANIFGRAQTLTADIVGQSGTFAIVENPEKFARASLGLRVPVHGRANLTFNVSPYVEYRNDHRDRSAEVGVENTLLYQLAPLSSIALRHRLATRRIYEYRFGDISAGVDLLQLLQRSAEGVLDSLGTRINTHTLSASASLGALDVPTDPSRGLVIEPTITATVPGSLTSADHVTATIRASTYVPATSWLTLAVRVGGGRLLPYGKSVPKTPDDALKEFFRLRDVLFTAGGASDVRGWRTGLLGPKFPRVTIAPSPDSSGLVVSAKEYTPIGGFNLAHGTFEARVPIALLGPRVSAHAFVDAGRVWTTDSRFTDGDDSLGVEKLFWAAGAGFDYATPIGAVRVEFGYKLNPSILDLADAGDVARAIIGGTPVELVPRYQARRLQFHIGLGRRL